MNQKTVITCAVTGSADTTGKSPAVPVTPKQIADAALDAGKAGAAVVHIHVRDPETGKASMDLELYRETVGRIRETGSDIVINLTTGPGGRFIPGDIEPIDFAAGTSLKAPETRMQHIADLLPDICTLDVATLNFGEHAMVNVPKHLRAMADRAKELGVTPELEVFDSGHILLAKQLIKEGHLKSPALFQLCLGIPWGAPATPEGMAFMKSLLPEDAMWSAFGISRGEFPMVAQATMLGGHTRVGLEDNLYMARGEMAKSNAQLVERAVQIIESIGGEVADPSEARTAFGLVRRND
ncbi:3-keto-5-aminohexanoate cleavage protein [Nisaea sp.]|jgi:3-dehydrocarnitine:acetyl-CoA trimethylamine transferase|uniref:3-keto-5-aminohexanoate cleavage protein n=1 Tax=Nisaea sp. TaxID=2024842 RepID=UPI002B279F79|nr:3-keto-5-aminohexanoate cleavage protein [Nisaea sp.]